MYEANAPANETPGLEDYLKAIQSRKWLVIACAIAGLILASLFAGSRTSVFDADAVVVLRPTPVGSNNPNTLAIPNLETERATLASLEVADEVTNRLQLATDPRDLLEDLIVRFEPTGLVLELTYTSTDASQASGIVNSFAEVYVEQRNDDANDLSLIHI